MFVGHFAVALSAKRAEPRLSLALLFAASQFLDILWPVFVLTGIEHTRIVAGITAASPLDLYDIPWSHGLVTSLGWSVLFAAPWWARRRWRSSLVVAGCVFSHFVLDWITHRPDLPLWPGSETRFGLGLWNSLYGSILVELALFGAGVWSYASATRPTGRMGNVGFWAMCLVLAAAWLSGPFSPPPPDIETVVWTALAFIPVILIWVRAIDRRRESTIAAEPAPARPACRG